MLNRTKLIAAIDKAADVLFMDHSSSFSFAKKIWQQLCADPFFAIKVQQVLNPPWPVPFWQDSLGLAIPIKQHSLPYQVTSIDGSQIYPDRHMPIGCFLVNIGEVTFSYGLNQSTVAMSSTPYIFPFAHYEEDWSVPAINCRRHELELQHGLLSEYCHNKLAHYFILFDGSLIFWHLEALKGLKERFLNIYLNYLLSYREHELCIAGYISTPKSKELVNLMRLFLCNYDTNNIAAWEPIKYVTDAMIASFFVPPYHRTIIFKNQSSISLLYPSSIVPHFFYLNTGTEIGRVEIPAYIANNQLLIDQLAACLLDQCKKGNGYPIVLAEAHEQAVVKGPDREFFYLCLQKLGHKEHGSIFKESSLKQQAKIRMGV